MILKHITVLSVTNIEREWNHTRGLENGHGFHHGSALIEGSSGDSKPCRRRIWDSDDNQTGTLLSRRTLHRNIYRGTKAAPYQNKNKNKNLSLTRSKGWDFICERRNREPRLFCEEEEVKQRQMWCEEEEAVYKDPYKVIAISFFFNDALSRVLITFIYLFFLFY